MITLRAAELAADFDGSFARAHREPSAHTDALVIELARDRYALRISDVAGVFVDRPITRVPSTRSDLVGIAGIRGAIVPVFDLAALLGHPPAPAPRWLAIAARSPIALAFARFAGYVRIPASDLGAVIEVDGGVVPVIDIASIVGVSGKGKP